MLCLSTSCLPTGQSHHCLQLPEYHGLKLSVLQILLKTQGYIILSHCRAIQKATRLYDPLSIPHFHLEGKIPLVLIILDSVPHLDAGHPLPSFVVLLSPLSVSDGGFPQPRCPPLCAVSSWNPETLIKCQGTGCLMT